MFKIIVASKNPVKINATRIAFEKMFPNEPLEVLGVSTESGVPNQPIGNEETIRGAENRAHAAAGQIPDADYFVGIEGGIEDEGDEVRVIAWTIIHAKNGLKGKARAATFLLPPPITQLLREGKELTEADDIVFGRTNSGQQNGAIGILTHDIIDRTQYYVNMVVLALIPFVNEELYNT